MTGTDTLAVHAAAPDGERGVLLLMWRPGPRGEVRCREWSSEQWLAPGRDLMVAAAELLARIEQWARAGWVFSEPLARVRAWLQVR